MPARHNINMYVPKLRTPLRKIALLNSLKGTLKRRTWVPVSLPNLKTRLSSENKVLSLFHERNRPQAWLTSREALTIVGLTVLHARPAPDTCFPRPHMYLVSTCSLCFFISINHFVSRLLLVNNHVHGLLTEGMAQKDKS